LYCHVLFFIFFIFSTQSLHHTFSSITAVAEREPENDNDGDNNGDADEDFKSQNIIKICCIRGAQPAGRNIDILYRHQEFNQATAG
jgi:hypothetical protein